MKIHLATACMALFAAFHAAADDAGMAQVGDIMIHQGWARASIGNAPNSAAYMTVMTHGEAADKLVGVATSVAESAELHNHIMEDGVARMRPVEAIEVKPDTPVSLEPGGLHVMIMGLKDALEAGGNLPLTLTFEQAGEVTIDIPIKSLKEALKHEGDHKHGS